MQRRQIINRMARVKIQERAESDQKLIIGYSAVFYRENEPDTQYALWSDYFERLMPGCFDRALNEGHDARALFNHDSSNLLGRVSAGTCKLEVDDIGLRFEVPIDANDPDHQRVVSKINRGDLSGCSFAFNNASSDWEELNKDGETIWIRKITDLDLFDVGPVTWPAYEATEVGVRTAVHDAASLAEARSAMQAHRSEVENHRLGLSIAVNSRCTELD